MWTRSLIGAWLLIASLVGDALAQQATPNAGAIPFKLITTASTNATLVKGSIGNLYDVVAINQTATVAYLKFYDKATAPTCGTDVPVLTLPLPASATVPPPVVVDSAVGIQFYNGIGICVVGGVADGDSSNAVANALVNLNFK